MQIGSVNSVADAQNAQRKLQLAGTPGSDNSIGGDLAGKGQQELFEMFVGETFFGQMLKSMRKTIGEPAYFHGGRAEEMFQEQLDQTMTKEMSKSSGKDFAGPMWELFNLNVNGEIPLDQGAEAGAEQPVAQKSNDLGKQAAGAAAYQASQRTSVKSKFEVSA